MRFSAPADVSAISLAAGEFAVADGHVDLPDDIGAGDLAGLAIILGAFTELCQGSLRFRVSHDCDRLSAHDFSGFRGLVLHHRRLVRGSRCHRRGLIGPDHCPHGGTDTRDKKQQRDEQAQLCFA